MEVTAVWGIMTVTVPLLLKRIPALFPKYQLEVSPWPNIEAGKMMLKASSKVIFFFIVFT